MRLTGLAAFNKAGRQSRTLGLAGGLCLALAILAGIGAWEATGAATAMLAGGGAAGAELAAGCLSAAMLASARALSRRAEADAAPRAADPGPPDSAAVGRQNRLLARARRRAGWQQALAAGLLAALGAALGMLAWTEHPGWDGTPTAAALLAGGAFVAAFALLVLERHLAALDASAVPAAPTLAALLRVPLAMLLLCGTGGLLLYAGFGFGAYAGRISAILGVLVSGEMLLRAGATLFVPFPPLDAARAVAASAVAAALMPRRPRPVAATVRDLFGIDLSRSWALAFMRAALAPVLAVLVLFGWGLSGMEALRLDQRAIYERFGRPVAVLGPGLHLHLPWPVGRLRPVELGIIHDVPIAFDLPAAAGTPAWTSRLPGPEDLPGPEADRLWDETHPSEAAYLVASLSRGRQGFESVNIDLRVVYRVGLSDKAALDATFISDDPQRLVQTRMSRLLAHYFADHTLQGVLGADRSRFGREVGAALQAELDAIPAGMEVMAVVVEAVHPPPGAATAYHAVQTAEISAHTALAEQQGYAVGRIGEAGREATLQRDRAAALAHETVVDAGARSAGFTTDRAAAAASPTSFLLERRLDRLSAGLAHRQVLILDHRLNAGQAGPLIDLRPAGSGAAVTPSQDPAR